MRAEYEEIDTWEGMWHSQVSQVSDGGVINGLVIEKPSTDD